jgi:hypothetical protein
MSEKIEGKVIVFVSDAVRGGGNDNTPGVLLRFLAAGLPVPSGWERVVLEPEKEPSRVMENFGHIGRCPARLSRHVECLCEQLEPELERPPRCDHLYSELLHVLPVRCGLDRGHEGSHRFTWPA